MNKINLLNCEYIFNEESYYFYLTFTNYPLFKMLYPDIEKIERTLGITFLQSECINCFCFEIEFAKIEELKQKLDKIYHFMRKVNIKIESKETILNDIVKQEKLSYFNS